MRTCAIVLVLFAASWARAGALPDIVVSEVPIAGGGIYTVTINQPPSPPGPIWSITAWGIANQDASFAETLLTGWAGDVFDELSWNSQLTFETGTPGLPIFLFTSGVAGLSEFSDLFGLGVSQGAVFWNESYFGNPLVASSSNFTWSLGTQEQASRAGNTTAFAVITSSDGQNLMCNVGVDVSLALNCNPITTPDADGDLVSDSIDNCTLASNPGQEDTDFDGYGNACDPDLNNDEIVNFLDLSLFAAVFLTDDENADFNSDGVANFVDLSIMSSYFFQPPGPSAGFN